jgi:2'-5' RNA ligase
VDQNLLESDCELLSSDSREGLGKPWALVNYGDEDLAPWAQWDPTPPEDEKTKAETLDKLATAVPLLDTQLAKHGKQIDLPAMLSALKVQLKDLEKPETPAPISPAMQQLRAWAASAPPDARVMVALYPSPEIQAKLALEGGEPKEELHVTLAYLGRVSEIGADLLEELANTVRRFAERHACLEGTIGGFGRFSASESSDGKDVIYASIDVPSLASLREKLVMELEGLAPAKREHGFTPHMTLAYVGSFEESPVDRLEPVEVSFSALELVIEGQRQAFPLKGQRTFSSVVPFRAKMRGAR